MQQSKSQLSLAPSSIAQSVSAFSTHELSSHAYWLLKKEIEHFSIENLEEKGGKKEILWTGLRAPLDTANAKLIRSEDPILLCAISNEDAVITGILESTLSVGKLAEVCAADPIPDATAWDADFSRRHWVTPPDVLDTGCSIGYNPYWAVRVQLVAKFERPVSLKALSEHPAWRESDVWDTERMLVEVSEEQWDAVIDILPQ